MGVTDPFWSTLSSLRRARIFHPDGPAFAATLSVPGGARTGAPLFDNRGEYRAVARISRGVGLPEPLPDTIGLAVRVCDAHGPGRHQDFLMNTSIDAPLLHHLILPGVAPQQSYSSVLGYRVGARLCLVGAAPRGAGAFDVGIAPLLGRLVGLARLELADRLSAEASEELRFNPWHCGGGIRPVGPFQGWRRSAYRSSQEGRAAARSSPDASSSAERATVGT